MRPLFFLLASLVLILSSAFTAEDITRTTTTVMSYNIHNEHCSDQARPWDERKAMVAQVIRSREPEIVGVQGSTLGQIHWLKQSLGIYDYYAPSKTELEMGVDLCPIMYATDTYELLDQGTFIIGDTESSCDADKRSTQFLNWVKLKHKRDLKEVYVLNTRACENADNSSAMAERLETLVKELVGDHTFMLLGDFDCTPESHTVSKISAWARDSYASSLVSISSTESTMLGWDREMEGKRVDYVFLSPDIPANSYEVLDIASNGKYPSDHLPVLCKLRLQ